MSKSQERLVGEALDRFKEGYLAGVKGGDNAGVEALTKRECGGCTHCCTAPYIDESDLKKVAGETCVNCTGEACGIYDSRPNTCRGYLCGYAMGWPVNRPDKTGVSWCIQEAGIVGHAVGDVTRFLADSDFTNALPFLLNLSFQLHNPATVIVRSDVNAINISEGVILEAKVLQDGVKEGIDFPTSRILSKYNTK